MLEFYQESSNKPIKWNGSNIKRLLGTSLPEGEDTELTIIVSLKAKNFHSRLQTLDKITASGLPIKIDGKSYRVSNQISHRASGVMKYLPSRSEPVDIGPSSSLNQNIVNQSNRER